MMGFPIRYKMQCCTFSFFIDKPAITPGVVFLGYCKVCVLWRSWLVNNSCQTPTINLRELVQYNLLIYHSEAQ